MGQKKSPEVTMGEKRSPGVTMGQKRFPGVTMGQKRSSGVTIETAGGGTQPPPLAYISDTRFFLHFSDIKIIHQL